MGSTKSKTSAVTGDPQVQVLNHLEVNEEHHAQHDVKITILLIMVAAQLLLTVFKCYKCHVRSQALKAARSIATIQNI